MKAGKEEEVKKAFAPALVATWKEAVCVTYHLNRDPDHPETYTMSEQFKSIAALELHLKEKHTETLLKTVVPMREGDPTLKVLVVPE